MAISTKFTLFMVAIVMGLCVYAVKSGESAPPEWEVLEPLRIHLKQQEAGDEKNEWSHMTKTLSLVDELLSAGQIEPSRVMGYTMWSIANSKFYGQLPRKRPERIRELIAALEKGDLVFANKDSMRELLEVALGFAGGRQDERVILPLLKNTRGGKRPSRSLALSSMLESGHVLLAALPWVLAMKDSEVTGLRYEMEGEVAPGVSSTGKVVIQHYPNRKLVFRYLETVGVKCTLAKIMEKAPRPAGWNPLNSLSHTSTPLVLPDLVPDFIEFVQIVIDEDSLIEKINEGNNASLDAVNNDLKAYESIRGKAESIIRHSPTLAKLGATDADRERILVEVRRILNEGFSLHPLEVAAMEKAAAERAIPPAPAEPRANP